MRWLRVAQNQERERGAIAIVAAILVTALIGLGAVAVDLGQVYAERAQLQNGADSTALAIAQECYKANTCTNANSASWLTWAQSLANGNANDNATTIKSVVFSGTANSTQVTVTTSTLDGTTGAGFLTPMFSKALNVSPVTVGAVATAAFSPLSQGSAFPLALSNACWDLNGRSVGDIMQMEYKPASTCTGPAGHAIPGGWGWLARSSPCQAVTAVGQDWVPQQPGNPPPTDCYAVLTQWITTLQSGGAVYGTFPVFDQAQAGGANGVFHIIGYATLRLYGWKFGETSPYAYNNTAAALTGLGINPIFACSAGVDRCVIAQFVRYDTVDSSQGGGQGQDLGTPVISLIR